MGGDDVLNMTDEGLEQHIVTLIDKLECLRRDDATSEVDGRMPARLEVRSVGLWRAVVSECAASFVYVLVVCGAAAGAGVGASTSAVLLATAIATGCVVATLTICFDKVSGAHINPVVSVALCVRRRVSPLRAALYVTAQCGGAIAGAATLYGVTVPGYQGNLSASMWGGTASWERLAAELVLSALLVAARLARAGPAHLGAAYTACTFVSMPYLNPARALGPAFVLGRWEGQWAAWVGAIVGGVGAALVRGRAGAGPGRDPHDDDKFPPHAASYCAAPAPAPARRAPEPLYSGTRSLYCRSPPPTRHTLHRSQSVYSKAGSVSVPLAPAHSMLLRPHATHATHATHMAHTAPSTQNLHNAQRDVTTYGGPRPGPTGASVQERRESVYGTRRAPLSEDSAYGSYRPPPPAALPAPTTHAPHVHAPHAPHATHGPHPHY